MQKNYNIFISGLVELFGSYDDEAKKFANKSNSVIARELFYSDSQFSRLINQTASEGEYERANKIISRYKENQDLKNAIKGQRASLSPIDNFLLKKSFLFPLVIAALIASAFLGAKLWPAGVSITDTNPSDTEKNKMDHMLYWAFELSEVKPYTNLEELPDDCNYPCYRLQGKWQLEHEYKLPVFGEQRGFHYVAKEVNMYARCMSEKNNGGKDLEGFEYQKHEIWYDTKEKPIDSFLIQKGQPELKESYQDKKFSDDEDFILVAHLHTFFRNEFQLEETNIRRKGKVIGRHLVLEDLSSASGSMNKSSAFEIKNEISNIVNIRVEDFSKPIKCEEAEFEKNTVYDIEEKDILKFQCTLTTARFPLKYEKNYILVDQVIKNNCRPQN